MPDMSEVTRVIIKLEVEMHHIDEIDIIFMDKKSMPRVRPGSHILTYERVSLIFTECC